MTLRVDKNHQLLAEGPEGELGVLCQEVEVIRNRENLLTGDLSVELGIWADGERKQFEVDRAAFLEGRFMTELMRKGLVISATKENIEALTDYLIEAAESAPTEYFHVKLGFATRGETRFYLTDTAAGSSKESHFHDPKLTRPKGSLDKWKNMVHEDVMGHTPLELALGISFSAPISHILQEEGMCAEVPIWAIIGKSSTGKTTALRLMASVYGSPEEGTGFLQDFNATENAFFRQLSNGMGVPHIIDEATMKSGGDVSSMIYRLSKGSDKARCESSGELKERSRFSDPVIISGECSLTDKSTSNLGVQARMVELNLPWTEDAEHARRLTQKVKQNYGTAIAPIADTLLRFQAKPTEIRNEFQRQLEKMRELVGSVPGPEERLLNMYATVLVGTRLAGKILDLRFDCNAIRAELAGVHRENADNRNLARKLYDGIQDKIAQHSSHFPKENSELLPPGFWGQRSSKDGKSVTWVTEDTFQRFADELRFGNYKQLLHDMAEQGLVWKSDTHYLHRHPLWSRKVKCYCLIDGV